MEHRALAALMVRLVGLWELVVAVGSIPASILPFFEPAYLQKAGLAVALASAFSMFGVPFILGLLLIYFPKTVVTRVLRIEGIEPQDGGEARFLERVAVSALGLWFAVQAVIDQVYHLSKWHLYRRMMVDSYSGAAGPSIGPQEYAGIIAATIQLALGLWLLLGARGLVNALERLRRNP
jgi:hypothetical protein